MRESDADSPVMWPAWCYNTGENRIEKSQKEQSSLTSGKYRRKRKNPSQTSANNTEERMNGLENSTSVNLKIDVKQERCSPCSGNGDNNSSGSRSNTPCSLVGFADPMIPSPSSSPADQTHISSEQPVVRNYSDIMRSLAAKYNNSNPNEYYGSSRNGFCHPSFGDIRLTPFKTNSPFSNLISPLGGTLSNGSLGSSGSNIGAAKENSDSGRANNTTTDCSLFPNFGFNSFASTGLPTAAAANIALFPSLVDATSTQALLQIVRSASVHSANQLENYIKASSSFNNNFSKTLSSSESLLPPSNNPLDLSSSAIPSTLIHSSKKRKLNHSNNSNGYSENIEDKKNKNNNNRNNETNDGNNNRNIKVENEINNYNNTTSDKNISNIKIENVEAQSDQVKTNEYNDIDDNDGSTTSLSSQILLQSNNNSDRLGSFFPTICPSFCGEKNNQNGNENDNIENISEWSVDDVCNFVSSIDVCAPFSSSFREQNIDGMSLPMLTEKHLTTTMNMKLGPALKLRAILSQKLGHCTICTHCFQCHVNKISQAVSPASQIPSSAEPK